MKPLAGPIVIVVDTPEALSRELALLRAQSRLPLSVEILLEDPTHEDLLPYQCRDVDRPHIVTEPHVPWTSRNSDSLADHLPLTLPIAEIVAALLRADPPAPLFGPTDSPSSPCDLNIAERARLLWLLSFT